jgi:trk system potassium uptake protein
MKVIIIGGGQVGSYIASLLIAGGHEIKVIENRELIFKKLENELPHEVLIFGSGTNPQTLEAAGIASANVVAAVTGFDEVNLVVSTLAKLEFGVPRVVARVNNPKNAWLYNAGMGVDVAVNQADLMAHFIVEEMAITDVLTLLKLNRGDYSIVQINVHENSKAKDQLLKNLSIPSGMVFIAITRDQSVLIPKGDTKILAGDEILLLTNSECRKLLDAMFA